MLKLLCLTLFHEVLWEMEKSPQLKSTQCKNQSNRICGESAPARFVIREKKNLSNIAAGEKTRLKGVLVY